MQLHAAMHASVHTYMDLPLFDAGNLAAAFIAANWHIDTPPLELYVCRKPKQVDARFRYTVRACRGSSTPLDYPGVQVACFERDEPGPLFVVEFDAEMGHTRRPSIRK
jgi:hypothetical protein